MLSIPKYRLLRQLATSGNANTIYFIRPKNNINQISWYSIIYKRYSYINLSVGVDNCISNASLARISFLKFLVKVILGYYFERQISEMTLKDTIQHIFFPSNEIIILHYYYQISKHADINSYLQFKIFRLLKILTLEPDVAL